MIIFPLGLYRGERLAQCSDQARLHFPLIGGLANGFGRMELSVPLIIDRAYGTFQNKPSKAEVTAWLAEYRKHHLLYVYRSSNGVIWGQFCGLPDGALPRYQTAADKRSPAPNHDDVTAFDAEYATVKRRRLEACENFVDLSEHFGNLPKAAEDCETLRNVSAGIGIGIGIGIGEEEVHSSPLAPDPAGSAPVKPAKDEEAKAVVRHIFGYFLEQTGRSEAQYKLTPKRLSAGLRMYRECLSRCQKDPEKAQLAMAAAVDGLVANDWLMGRAPKSKGQFTEWIQNVFGTVETMEARWKDGGFKPNV